MWGALRVGTSTLPPQVLHRALQERKAAIAARGGVKNWGDPTFVLDRFLVEQFKERDCGAGQGQGTMVDDELICDNVRAPA